MRPKRESAERAAQKRRLADQREKATVIDDSDDDVVDVLSEDEHDQHLQRHSQTPHQLSEYEQERKRTIERNQAELRRLGLAGRNENSQQATQKRKQPPKSKQLPKPTPQPPQQSAESSDSTWSSPTAPTSAAISAAQADHANAEAFFRRLLGPAAASAGLLDGARLYEVIRGLSLDLSPADVQEMIDQFDEGGKGALTLDDFVRAYQASLA